MKRISLLPGDPIDSTEHTKGPQRVPPGHIWISSDAKDGIDSRRLGPVSLGLVQGLVVYPRSSGPQTMVQTSRFKGTEMDMKDLTDNWIWRIKTTR